MKFVELKSSLINIEKGYYISGKDGFLVSSAQKLIENACAKSLPDFNIVRFSEENFDIQQILDACLSFPMIDNYRCVVIKGGNFSKEDLEKITKYLKNPNSTTCLVIIEPVGEKDFSGKSLAKIMTNVDCNYLDETLLQKIVIKQLANLGGNMVDFSTVNLLVAKDVEYSIFELTNALSEKNREKTFDVLNYLLQNGQNAQVLLALILNSFRRMFYSTVSKNTPKEIAEMLDVKEYAVKISKSLGLKFTPIKLKKILELGAELDLEIRRGGVDSLNAIYALVSNVLLM